MDAIWNIWQPAKRLFCLTVCCLLLAACGPQDLQRPTFHGSRREVRVDSTLLQTIELNQHLAQEADRELTRYVEEGYAQCESGYWAKNLRVVDHPLQEDVSVTMQMQVFLLDGQQVEQIREQVVVGKVGRMQALADAVGQMERGQTVSLIVPWYLAYGATGNEHVPPYTNLRVELTIEP